MPNRRQVIAGLASIPLSLYAVKLPAETWSEYLPCGQRVRFSVEEKMFFGEPHQAICARMRRRGIEYSLMTGSDENATRRLRRSLSLTCHHVDAREGLTDDSRESFNRYLGEEYE